MTKDGVQMLLDTGQQREVLEELLAALGENVWHRDPPPQQFELFSVGGVEVLPSYTFTDKAVPGGFRRVSSRWATPRQVTRDALVADVKANEAVLAATRKRENAARIEGRVGDTDALLWDHRDGIVGLAA
jgi:hypothetical protein